MSLKKNFYQALSELLSGENPAGSEPERPAAMPQTEPDLSAETPQAASGQEAAPYVREEPGAHSAASAWKNPFQREAPPRRQSDAPPPPSGAFPQVNEMTVISKNTIVVGDIRSLANVTIEGNVRGRVEILKDATVQGMLVGDLACKNARLQGSSVQGNVLSKENVFIDHNTTVLGDLAAQYASIDGRVKGNIEAGGKVEFLENAIIAGDVYTSSISVADGANIKGFVSTAYLNEHGDAAFPSQVVIDEETLLSMK